MEKYRRIETSKAEEEIKENEIRVTHTGKMGRYISYATKLFQERNLEEITLKAMGKAISKTVNIAEILKRRIPGLHQITTINSTEIIEVYAPKEEGLNKVETKRHVSAISIVLTNTEPDTTSIGYQLPIPEESLKPTFFPALRGRGRGRARGRARGRGRSRGSYSMYQGNEGEKKKERETEKSEPEKKKITEKLEDTGRGGDYGIGGGVRGRGTRGRNSRGRGGYSGGIGRGGYSGGIGRGGYSGGGRGGAGAGEVGGSRGSRGPRARGRGDYRSGGRGGRKIEGNFQSDFDK